MRGGGVHAPGLEAHQQGVRLPPVQQLGPRDGSPGGIGPGPPVLLHGILAHLHVVWHVHMPGGQDSGGYWEGGI